MTTLITPDSYDSKRRHENFSILESEIDVHKTLERNDLMKTNRLLKCNE